MTGPAESDGRSRHTRLVDAEGNVVDDPRQASAGEIVERGRDGEPRRRTWFLIEEVEVKWLPVRESAFLIWVLAVLVAVWVAVALFLHFSS